MLKRQRRNVEDVGASGSLNDLSFLLIIFFIVIAGFNVNKGFLLNLPEKSKPRIVMKQHLMKCTLTNDEMILLDGKSVNQNELETEIKSMKAKFPDMTFLLLIQDNVPYQKVIDVVYLVRNSSVENFSFKMDGRS